MKNYVLMLWGFIDPIYYKCSRLTYIYHGEQKNNILRVRLTRYKGKQVTLSDGTQICKNDLLVKIHLHNARLLKEMKEMKNDIRRGWRVYRQVKSSLPGVIPYIQNHVKEDEIKGIIGISMLSKGAERLGFETISLSNPFYKCFKRLAFMPISFLSSDDSILKSLRSSISSPPKYLFMSKDNLWQMYGSQGEGEK